MGHCENPGGDKVIFVDFHADATAEKMAMGWYLDGKVTACIGTHTHTPTARTAGSCPAEPRSRPTSA